MVSIRGRQEASVGTFSNKSAYEFPNAIERFSSYRISRMFLVNICVFNWMVEFVICLASLSEF